MLMLSVLIPSIRERTTGAVALYDEVVRQSEPFPGDVEVLMLMDNRRRSIGMKRQALLDIASGAYVAFADDDDWIAPSYMQEILSAIRTTPSPDVVSFDTWCTLSTTTYLIRHGLELENTEVGPDGATRKPFHVHPWRSSIAKQFRFPDVMYGEDWDWVKQLLPRAHVQAALVCGPLYHYRKF